MNLDDVHRGIHRRKRRKRVGRGTGSGHGKTCGRGHKGQGSRSGFSMHPTFEGGQMPLVRRVPKRGFHNRWADQVAIVNLADLEARFDDGDEVNPESLRAKNLAKGRYDLLKIRSSRSRPTASAVRPRKRSSRPAARPSSYPARSRCRRTNKSNGPRQARRRDEKGTGTFCRNGPEGASHKMYLSPFRSRQGRTKPCGKKSASSSRSRSCAPRSS